MIVVPGARPLTRPVAALMVATRMLLLLHEPDGVISLNAVVLPTQTDKLPEIAAGVLSTDIVVVVKQPEGSV